MELPGHSTGLLLLMILVSLVVTMSESYRNHQSGDARHAFTKWILALLSDWSKMTFRFHCSSLPNKDHFWRPIAAILSDTLGYSSTCQVSWNELLQHTIYIYTYVYTSDYKPLFKSCSNNLKYHVPFHLAKGAKAAGTAKSIQIAHEKHCRLTWSMWKPSRKADLAAPGSGRSPVKWWRRVRVKSVCSICKR